MKTYYHTGNSFDSRIGATTYFIEIPSIATAAHCKALAINSINDLDVTTVIGRIGYTKHHPKDGPFIKKIGNRIAEERAKEVVFTIKEINVKHNPFSGYRSVNIKLEAEVDNKTVRVILKVIPNRTGPYVTVSIFGGLNYEN